LLFSYISDDVLVDMLQVAHIQRFKTYKEMGASGGPNQLQHFFIIRNFNGYLDGIVNTQIAFDNLILKKESGYFCW